MAAPTETRITRDGREMRCVVYPESTTFYEYHEAGCLIMITEPSLWNDRRRDLNVRLDTPSHGDGSFAILRGAYVDACARHGFPESEEAAQRVFFDLTRGWGVLWASATLID